MKYMYQHLLDPDLYESSQVARFINNLFDPEIETASNLKVSQLIKKIMAVDDVNCVCNNLYTRVQRSIIETGSFPPAFFASKNKEHQVKLAAPIPTTREKSKNFLVAGKALAFTQPAQCIFFATMQPMKDRKIISGNLVTDSTAWGILIIGSSLRGNCFITLAQMERNENQITFDLVEQKITREGKFSYPFSRFFYIQNEKEMTKIISQIPKLIRRGSITTKEGIINFATVLKALNRLNYNT